MQARQNHRVTEIARKRNIQNAPMYFSSLNMVTVSNIVVVVARLSRLVLFELLSDEGFSASSKIIISMRELSRPRVELYCASVDGVVLEKQNSL